MQEEEPEKFKELMLLGRQLVALVKKGTPEAVEQFHEAYTKYDKQELLAWHLYQSFKAALQKK